MKNERISVRIDDEFKKKLEINANKGHKTLSKYISTNLRETVENDGLTDSQGQFLKLFDLAFIQSFELIFNHLLVILNKNNFNTEWLLRENNLFYKYLKIPQNKDDLQTSFVMHPISGVTKGKLLKEIRTQSARKKMSTSNIIVRIRYTNTSNKTRAIKGRNKYVSKKNKPIIIH